MKMILEKYKNCKYNTSEQRKSLDTKKVSLLAHLV